MSIPLPALPEDNMQICLTLPNSPEWRQIYMGALQIMAQWWYWQVSSPIDAEDVIQRVMECSAITGSSYEGCMIIDCQEIIDCINSTPELRQLISKLGTGYPVPLDQPPITSISDMSMISDNTACDNDRLFGAVTGLVDLMNDIAEDFLERLQDQANTVSRIAELIEVIPGVGEVVPADLVTLAENFLEDLFNLYQSEYTVALRDQYRCDLFCLYKDDCNFSIEDAMDYFAEQITEGINIVDFGSFIGQYILGEFTGPSLVASWNVLILGMLQFGSEVLNIDADKMVLMVSAMFNDPDSDWTILCTECPEGWTREFDFTVDDQDWNAILATPNNTPRADYITDTGWTANDYNSGGVNTRSAVRIWNDDESRDANNILMEVSSTVTRTIGIFVWTCDNVGTVIESVYSQEGINLATGTNNFDVDLTVPTLAHAGYRVDFRSTNGEIRMTAFATKYTLSGEE